MTDIYEFLHRHGISYERCDHPAVFTCEEADRLVPPLRGERTKNLFLKDKKGKLFLVVVGHDKSVDLKALAAAIGCKNLSFASPALLEQFLGVQPGSATVLGLVADTEHAVDVIIDEVVWHADWIQCHPLTNTATVILSHDGLETVLSATGHTAKVMDIPERAMERH